MLKYVYIRDKLYPYKLEFDEKIFKSIMRIDEWGENSYV